MKIRKKNVIITLLIMLIIIIAFLPYQFIFSKAEEVSEEYALNATLYDTNQYSSGTGTALTEEGAEVNGWTHETSKYLQIDPVVPADGNKYIVSVKLPQEFYIVASELATPAGYKKVEFTKNESITINSSTTYNLNTYSGTAEYTMNNMGVSGTIQLEIGYDVVLWDKQKGSNLTPDGVEPIVVTVSREDAEGQLTQLKKVSIGKATAGNGITDSIAHYVYVGTNISSTAFKDQKVRVTIGISANEGKTRYKYYPELIFNINLPVYTDSSGTKHYLTPDEDGILVTNIKYSSCQSDTTKMLSDGIITINLKNAYFMSSTIIEFEAGPLSEELQNLSVNTFNFVSGKITAIADGKNGNTGIQYFSKTISTITYIKELSEKVTLSKGTPNISILERPDGAVSEIGGFRIQNTGTGESCAKTIYNEFDTENTKLIKVTTINTLADNVQEYIDITYTLVNENGERVYLDTNGNLVDENSSEAEGEWTYSLKNKYYNATKTTNANNKLSRSMLPEKHREYYFKSIKYVINKIDALTPLYLTSASASFSSGGNFFGYVSENASHGQSVKCRIEVKSSNSNIADLTSSLTTYLQSTSLPSYTIENVALNKDNVHAGESVELKGRIQMASYPYNNSTWLKGISLGIVLPKDITINEQAVSATTANKLNVEGFTFSNKDIGNGNNLWIIKFPSDVYIGYASEELGALPNGLYINFNIQLDTSFTMNNFTLFAKDMVMLSGYKQANSASGSYSWASKVDTYDLNENGSTTDKIAGVNASNTSSCQIKAQTATLDINDCITVERQGSITQEGRTESLLSQDDIVNYNLDISCTSGGRAEGFLYYIPIPKTTSNIDGFLIEKSDKGNFEFNLNGAITLTGNDIFNFEYMFEKGISYEQAQEVTTWYTQKDIENDSNLKWEDVTMIKVTLKGDGIENGNVSRITAKMKYGGNSYPAEAGMKNIWHSGGFYNYINSDRENAGNVATEGVSVDLKYSIELEEITLTAARNMTPQIEGNVNIRYSRKDKISTI